MELSQLNYFRTVARFQNMSKAASQLYVTQSTLSQNLRKLEDELGFTLFTRRGKSLALNELGQVVLKYSDEIFALLEEMRKELADRAEGSSAPVSISINTSTALLVQALPEFKQHYPQLLFQVAQSDFSLPDEDNYDLCINSYSIQQERENECPLLKERILVALPQGHPLSRQESILMEDLRNELFIRPAGKELQNQLITCCQNTGFKPNIAYNCDEPSTLLDFIEMGAGISLVPEITWRSTANRKIELRPIRGQELFRYIALSWRKNSYLSKSALLFRDFFIRYIQTHYPDYAIM